MQPSEYRLSTVWRLEAPLPAVWTAIHDSARWPEWWKNVERVAALEAGSGDGVGALQRYTWKGRLPYRVVFDVRVTRIEPLVALEGIASGDLEGTGCWRFSHERGGVTVVRYEWRVHTRRGWMNVFAPLARPFFQWNHDFVMREGGISLARLLDARLVSIEHRS
ncbi:SRPBCC family protein [Paraburkholderia sp. SARCC-3016]|uniref:SRPBCC family protein n=1 Tax=Paraburkholderia sp. SARCC-3016 TaxID=3058611 RepID=UPI002807D931|nr:SRPBCC family protein [Paraburkholderia sp. SARCC-3016]MDQ7976229.1 SRPBCC family protein [Paraburkholderia sp. SARCC-3016]